MKHYELTWKCGNEHETLLINMWVIANGELHSNNHCINDSIVIHKNLFINHKWWRKTPLLNGCII